MSKLSFVLPAIIAAALPIWAQTGAMRLPQMPGEFQPAVGSGATYHLTTAHNPDALFTYAVVGKEGEDYWLEIRSTMAKGNVVMKQLMSVPGGGQPPQIQRMIIQAPGQSPMEMPVGITQGAMTHAQTHTATGSGALGEKVGTETVTVTAGTFECEHYRTTSGGKTSDVWVSTKVSPYGLVKMISGETQMELQKVLANETSQITGEPMKLPGYAGHH